MEIPIPKIDSEHIKRAAEKVKQYFKAKAEGEYYLANFVSDDLKERIQTFSKIGIVSEEGELKIKEKDKLKIILKAFKKNISMILNEEFLDIDKKEKHKFIEIKDQIPEDKIKEFLDKNYDDPGIEDKNKAVEIIEGVIGYLDKKISKSGDSQENAT